MKQIKPQVKSAAKTIDTIQNDIRRIRTDSTIKTRTKTKFRKPAAPTTVNIRIRSKKQVI